MQLGKFLSLCATLLGFVGAVFLAKVVLVSAEQVLGATYHYSSVGWPSAGIISDKAGQKAETFASMILVFVAVVFQVCALLAKDETRFGSNRAMSMVMAILLVAVVGGGVHIGRSVLKKSYEMKIKRVAAFEYIRETCEERSCPLYRDVRAIAEEYFGLKKGVDEKESDFVRRVGGYVGYELPEDADFSRFK